MKKMTFLILAVSIGILSCKKDATSVTASIGLQPKLQFYANGTLVNLDAIATVDHGWLQSPHISKVLNASDMSGNFEFILAAAHTSISDINLGVSYNATLQVQSYSYNTNKGNLNGKIIDCGIFGVSYNVDDNTRPNGTYTITITTITNNLISGTFYGNLYPHDSGNPNAVITNGTFSNLPIE